MARGGAAPDPPSPRPSWAGRVLPRSVLGLSALLLSASLGAAFSGAVLYAYYEYRLDTSKNRAEEYAATFEERLEAAQGVVQDEADAGVIRIRGELEPLQRLAAGGETIASIRDGVSPSVWFVSTLGEDGSPSVGSAFVVFADDRRSYLLTSYATVRAATRSPGPAIRLRKGGEELAAALLTWDEGLDLAVVAVDRAGLPRLEWAPGEPPPGVGERVFSVSGLGSAGGAVSQGLVADASAAGLQHDAPIGTHFQGAPLVDADGRVLAVSSRTYAPLGFAPEAVFFAAPVRAACERLLACPDGAAASGLR